MKQVANSKCRSLVAARLPFKGSNLWGEWIRLYGENGITNAQQYVVVSYGYHFPLYIYANDMWFENEDGYSRTTARHKSQARPTDKTILLGTRGMIALMSDGSDGYQALVRQRILTGRHYG
jgi:hypothetical protein